MSINFNFKRRSDNKLIGINEIDKMINIDLNRSYHETNYYSQILMIITTIGDLCIRDNEKWDTDNFKVIIRDLFFNEKESKIIKKYLYDEYIYTSW